LRLLGGVFSFAVSHGMRADNPVRGVKAFKDGLRTRSLSAAEYKALGAALQAATDMWPPAVAAARFLCLSGWRVGEVLNLKGAAVDLTTRTARLGDTKTGYSVRPLSQAACDVLQELLPLAGDLAFPSVRGNGPMVFKKNFRKIRELGKLPADVSPHVLRHSFASTAANLNYSDSTIAALLGHKGRSVTSRYSHHADPVLLAAADAVANVIRALLDA
jgi:integrase